MILESWQVASAHIERRWWWVRVHSDTESLRRAAHRYAPWNGRSYWDNKTLACCQPARAVIEVGDDPNAPEGPLLWPAYGFAGVIRMSVEHLYPEVIYHELLHAACATYRMNVAMDLQIGTGYKDMDREEDLAYIYGQLAADMDTALRERAG